MKQAPCLLVGALGLALCPLALLQDNDSSKKPQKKVIETQRQTSTREPAHEKYEEALFVKKEQVENLEVRVVFCEKVVYVNAESVFKMPPEEYRGKIKQAVKDVLGGARFQQSYRQEFKESWDSSLLGQTDIDRWIDKDQPPADALGVTLLFERSLATGWEGGQEILNAFVFSIGLIPTQRNDWKLVELHELGHMQVNRAAFSDVLLRNVKAVVGVEVKQVKAQKKQAKDAMEAINERLYDMLQLFLACAQDSYHAIVGRSDLLFEAIYRNYGYAKMGQVSTVTKPTEENVMRALADRGVKHALDAAKFFFNDLVDGKVAPKR